MQFGIVDKHHFVGGIRKSIKNPFFFSIFLLFKSYCECASDRKTNTYYLHLTTILGIKGFLK